MDFIDSFVQGQVIPRMETAIQDIAKDQNIVLSATDPTEITHIDTNKIIVPNTINKLQAASNLIREYREEETYKRFSREYPNRFVNDFISTVQKLAKDEFGAIISSPIDTQGQISNNSELDLPLRYDGDTLITERASLGSIVCASWGDAIMDITPGKISVSAKNKYSKKVNAFLKKVQIKLNSESVIRGSAIEIYHMPNVGVFTRPVKVKINEGIFLEETVERIINNLLIPSLNETKKKAILLTGDFGTGKTETAIKIGETARAKFGRTFFYLKNADMFSMLLPFLSNYQKAIVFVEDIDQIVDGDRNTKLNDLLNSIDGAELKNADITFVFTTNAHNKINPAMRRPGRIDEVLHFDYATKDVVQRIYEYHLGTLTGADTIDFKEAAEYTPPNLQGAIITEIANRAKKYATKLHNGTISTDVVKDAIASMKHHIDFMRADVEKDKTLETAVGILGSALLKH